MAFHDVQFPPVISQGATGGPEHATTIVETTGGYERRNAWWSVPRGRWNVATGLKRRADLSALIAFHRAREGRAHSFRFKDWSDYQGTDQNLGTGTGALTTFQLRRVYTSGPTTVYRTITKPVSGTVTVKVNGVTVASSGNWSVNLTTGVITFNVAPTNGHAVTASFEFDVPARFDTDFLAITVESLTLGQWSDVPVIEVRE